ncbi:hypothetical protein LTR10_014480 [Elasticomyces elasticus]|uniref:MARVEL domain-containing protein n=1 Tax=Exophiala sideris TaxID=1016849 RepID=A0A0D1YFX2_9EURO|nr:hypothetical protein LTR10_014480 [Elasticomyces elasticus]KAK5023606.1 hypothetical protein LTS07_009114 [Exophiala sideris]KAK5179153.1 hypothetical protein LTR44_008307 [Eurotiomycetes sp. CCFEE 6388]KAK5029606.1 hypothetical protein LTR13_008526 [Exophiala sideris]KAK5053395.1 hypothetical protein LTR69_009353 [Exophiala sideris]
MVSRPINLILRAVEFFFILVIMALIGNVIAMAFAGNPSLVNYDMFVAAFSMLSLFYLFLAAWSDSFTGHPIIPIVLDALNVLFLFCAAVATAAELGVHSCSNSGYTQHNKLTNGANDRKGRCHELQAACAFFWFAWAAWTVSFVLSLLGGAGGGVNMRMGRRGPAMSQV